MLTSVQPESYLFSIHPSSESFSVLANPHVMQASRAFIAMLVLLASAVAPILSIPIELEPRDCADVGGDIIQPGACKKRD
ncbi:hypothetical protein V8E53_006789 [Lactarius tabidus]